MRISDETWQRAQIAERRFHKDPKEVAIEKYRDSYRQYFEWLGIDHSLGEKSIVEIGCADVPALYFCNWIGKNFPKQFIIEPMPSSILEEIMSDAHKNISLIKTPVENIDFDINADEVWLFNVIQHVIDPDLFIEKCKSWAKVIRFFEPVDQPISDCHPHAPTQADFKRWFGDAAKLYEGNPKAVNFHTANCMYGTWEK